jgi:hypothetical protein
MTGVWVFCSSAVTMEKKKKTDEAVPKSGKAKQSDRGEFAGIHCGCVLVTGTSRMKNLD